MRKLKHTQGPWKPVRSREDGLLIKSKGRRVVADVRPFMTSEDEANAVLMAAAPSMLECLQDVLMHGRHAYPEETLRRVIRQATFSSKRKKEHAVKEAPNGKQ